MPRSGSSLVEQVIASHSQVEGGGELDTMTNILTSSMISNKCSIIKDMLNNLDGEDIRQYADFYYNENRELIDKKPRFTDKLPFNYAFIGL